MLHLVVGAAHSGKSEYAENLISSLSGGKVYVGTLPRIPQYQSSIRAHQARRPSSWTVVELIGDLPVDMQLLRNAFSRGPNILVDGLTFYLLQSLAAFDANFVAIHPEVRDLIDRAAFGVQTVIVTDPPVPKSLPKHVPGTARWLLRYMHAMLARRASTITFIKDGRATSITRNDLLRLDRLRLDAKNDPRLSELPLSKKG